MIYIFGSKQDNTCCEESVERTKKGWGKRVFSAFVLILNAQLVWFGWGRLWEIRGGSVAGPRRKAWRSKGRSRVLQKEGEGRAEKRLRIRSGPALVDFSRTFTVSKRQRSRHTLFLYLCFPRFIAFLPLLPSLLSPTAEDLEVKGSRRNASQKRIDRELSISTRITERGPSDLS